MSQLQHIYLTIFKYIYPYLYSHFVTYLLYLGILCAISYWVYKKFKQYPLGSGLYRKTIKGLWLMALLFFIGYIAWFIMVHFESHNAFK